MYCVNINPAKLRLQDGPDRINVKSLLRYPAQTYFLEDTRMACTGKVEGATKTPRIGSVLELSSASDSLACSASMLSCVL